MHLATGASAKTPYLSLTPAATPSVDAPWGPGLDEGGRGQRQLRSLRTSGLEYCLHPLIDSSQRMSAPAVDRVTLGCRAVTPKAHILVHASVADGESGLAVPAPHGSATELPLCNARRGIDRQLQDYHNGCGSFWAASGTGTFLL